MPENLICPKCGREYPWQVPREYCLTCKTEFRRGTCYVCRQYSEDIRIGKCYKCSLVINRKYSKRIRDKANAEYEAWTEMVSTMPKPVKSFTEADWIKACVFFKGCALCDSPQIEARALFIPAHRGGAYTMYNVIPLCEKCATSYGQSIRSKTNPFYNATANYSAVQLKRLARMRGYLKERYDEYRQSNGV